MFMLPLAAFLFLQLWVVSAADCGLFFASLILSNLLVDSCNYYLYTFTVVIKGLYCYLVVLFASVCVPSTYLYNPSAFKVRGNR